MKLFKLPDLGEGLQDAELLEWRVKVGDEVAADEAIAVVETAKAVVEIPAPFAGRVARLYAAPGDIVPLGAPLIGFEGEAAEDAGAIVGETPREASAPEISPLARMGSGPTVRAAPAVRALARELNVDLSAVTASGPGGAIVPRDVRAAAGDGGTTEGRAGAEPLRGVRRAMAQSMALARSEVAPATVMDDADVDHWPAGADVTIRLVRAIVAGCRAEPSLNAWFDPKSLTRRLMRRIDVAIAVDLPEGLFAPVLRDVGARSDADLRAGLDRLRADAAARRIPPEEMRDSTIGLSNFGAIAGRYASPVVVPPCVAILAAGRVRPQAVVVDGAIAARRLLPLSLTFDHRAATGGEAVRFLAATIAELERDETRLEV